MRLFILPYYQGVFNPYIYHIIEYHMRTPFEDSLIVYEMLNTDSYLKCFTPNYSQFNYFGKVEQRIHRPNPV